MLDRQGTHLGKVKVSKAEVALWGIERYNKFKKRKTRWVKKQKKQVKALATGNMTTKSSEKKPEAYTENKSRASIEQWKRDIVHGREKKDAEEEQALPTSKPAEVDPIPA